MIMFEGSSGIIDIEEIAQTDDYKKFIVRGRVAIRIPNEVLAEVLAESSEKLVKKEVYVELKKLVDELGEDIK